MEVSSTRCRMTIFSHLPLFPADALWMTFQPHSSNGHNQQSFHRGCMVRNCWLSELSCLVISSEVHFQRDRDNENPLSLQRSSCVDLPLSSPFLNPPRLPSHLACSP
ncbi:hypothetical protein VTO42DRAFT_2319 [Malbranchea cinnamomea]